MNDVSRCVPELALKKIYECLETDIPNFKHEVWGFHFILDLFYRLPAFNKQIKYTEEGLIRISSKYFKKYFVKGYVNYINYLIRHKIIICDKIKMTGKSYGYNIAPELNSKIVRVNIPPNSIIWKKITDNYNKQKKYHRKIEPHIRLMKYHFKKNIKVKLENALRWLDEEIEKKTIGLNQYNVLLLSLYAIDEQELFFNINDTNGRIDSNLTNLKSELRPFVIGGYYHIDCQNSQPITINLLIDFIIENFNSNITDNVSQPTIPSLGTDKYKILCKELTDNDLNYLKFFPKMNMKVTEEFARFRADTFEKDFYKSLQVRYELVYGKEIFRKDVKDIVYKVFFSKNSSFLDEKRIFKQLYPNVYKLIYNLKKEKHNRFALCLQRIESELFIQRICKALVEENIIPFTIHDSVIVCVEDKEKALNIMKSEYLKMFNQTPNFICTEL